MDQGTRDQLEEAVNIPDCDPNTTLVLLPPDTVRATLDFIDLIQKELAEYQRIVKDYQDCIRADTEHIRKLEHCLERLADDYASERYSEYSDERHELAIVVEADRLLGKPIKVPVPPQELNFFVMLNTPYKTPVPMVNDKGEPALYASKLEACNAANNSALGRAYGYEVFERGAGA